jgi:hypothetical protein
LNDSKDMLNLPDDAYWNAPTSTLRDVFDRLSSEQLNGVLLGAPAHVSLDAHESLPLVAYRGGTFADCRALPFSLHAIVVGVHLERNKVFLANAVELEDVSGFASDSPLPDGYTASPFVIDARQRLSLAWQPGSYVFSIIMRDRISNRVKVDLGKSSQGYHDEAVDEFIARHRKRQPPPPVYPPLDTRHELPSYHRTPESPQIPAKNGVAVKIDRVLLLNSETRWIVRGAFRLPALPNGITRITLVGIGAEYGRWSLETNVPSYEALEHGIDGAIATGYFSFDLMQEAQIRSSAAQTYFIYAFSGETVSGPIPSALVPEAWLLPER